MSHTLWFWIWVWLMRPCLVGSRALACMWLGVLRARWAVSIASSIWIGLDNVKVQVSATRCVTTGWWEWAWLLAFDYFEVSAWRVFGWRSFLTWSWAQFGTWWLTEFSGWVLTELRCWVLALFSTWSLAEFGTWWSCTDYLLSMVHY